jgi:hypothetical protein
MIVKKWKSELKEGIKEEGAGVINEERKKEGRK